MPVDRENATGPLRQVLETMEKYPHLLSEYQNLSPFALECIEDADLRKRASASASPALFDESSFSQQSIDTTTTVPSVHAVSDFERRTYYNGIAGAGGGPDLLYRTGSAKYPWTRPTGRFASLPTKSAHGVFNTPLNEVWRAVLPQIGDLVKEKGRYTSIGAARFVTRRDGEETRGPVTIWITVPPGSTSADTAHDVSEAILALLAENGVEGVEVEWCEGVAVRL